MDSAIRQRVLRLGMLVATGASFLGHSAELVWTNSNGGDWEQPLNWSLNRVPAAEDTVSVSAPGEYVIFLGSGVVVSALDISNPLARVSLKEGSSLNILRELRLAGVRPSASVGGLGTVTVSGARQKLPVTGAGSVSLEWDPSEGEVEGYILYYGPSTRRYTQILPLSNVTNVSVHGLLPGITNFFAVSAYDKFGLESDWSDEVYYAAPNIDPTLSRIPDLVVNYNSGPHVIQLSGISAGLSEEDQEVHVAAKTSNSALFSRIAVDYTSPSNTGLLTLFITTNSFGQSRVSVTVDDGLSYVTRDFLVTISPTNLPLAGARWIITQNSGPRALDLMTAYAGGIGGTVASASIALGASRPRDLLESIGMDRDNRTMRVVPSFDLFGSVKVYPRFTDANDQLLPFAPTLTIDVIPTNVPPRMDPIEPIDIYQDSGPIAVLLSGIRSSGRPDQATLSVSVTHDNPAVIGALALEYVSPASDGKLTLTPTGTPGLAEVQVVVSDLQPTNNILTNRFAFRVRKLNVPPALDPLAEVIIEQPVTEPIIVNLTGISPGEGDDGQPVTITAYSEGPELLPDPQVVYDGRSATGQLILRPAADSLGAAEITVTVDDGQPRDQFASRSFRVRLEQPVDAMAAQVESITVARGDEGRLGLTLRSALLLTQFRATLHASSADLLELSASANTPEVEPGSVRLTPGESGTWSLEFSTVPGQALKYVRTPITLSFVAAAPGPSLFLPISLSQVEGLTADGLPISDWKLVTGRVVLVGSEPLLELLTREVPWRLRLHGKPFASYRVEYAPDPGVGWTSLRESVQVFEAPVDITLEEVQTATFFRAVEVSSP